MITLADFYMERDTKYAADFKPYIAANAVETVKRANAMLNEFFTTFPNAASRHVNSGWRPPAVNAATKGASPTSKHLYGQAVDLSDDDEQLDSWLNSPNGEKVLVSIGLWLEHPESTPRWSHVQTVPPPSGPGTRVFRVH